MLSICALNDEMYAIANEIPLCNVRGRTSIHEIDDVLLGHTTIDTSWCRALYPRMFYDPSPF